MHAFATHATLFDEASILPLHPISPQPALFSCEAISRLQDSELIGKRGDELDVVFEAIGGRFVVVGVLQVGL